MEYPAAADAEDDAMKVINTFQGLSFIFDLYFRVFTALLIFLFLLQPIHWHCFELWSIVFFFYFLFFFISVLCSA